MVGYSNFRAPAWEQYSRWFSKQMRGDAAENSHLLEPALATKGTMMRCMISAVVESLSPISSMRPPNVAAKDFRYATLTPHL